MIKPSYFIDKEGISFNLPILNIEYIVKMMDQVHQHRIMFADYTRQ